jgi:hypothetical protein
MSDGTTERERERNRQQSHVSRAAVVGRARSWWQLEDDPGAGSLSNTRLLVCVRVLSCPEHGRAKASQQIRGLGDIRPGCLPSVDSRTRESPDHASSPRRPDGVYVVAGPRHGARFERQDPGDSWASPFRQMIRPAGKAISRPVRACPPVAQTRPG